jgi:hypothetical protein
MEPNKGNKRRASLETELFLLKLKAIRLRQVWMYSDSQPTEIVLALANIFLAPLALSIELGASLFFSLIPMMSGIYQIICVASDDIDCRVRASMVTFGIYSASAVMYAITIGFPSPTHYGWLLFIIASFGSMSRLSREKIYRKNING